MSDLSLLLKYSFKNKVRPAKNKKGISKASKPITTVIQYLLPAVIFGMTIAPVMFITMKDLNIPMQSLGIDSSYSFLDIIFSLNFLGMGIMFFMNYSPSIIMNLYDSEMTQAFLTMPIKKSTIFWAGSIDSLLMTGLPLGMLLPIAVVYAIIMKANIFLSILAIVGFVIVLLGISMLGGILMSFFMSRTSAKRFTMFAYFGSIILYVFAANYFNPSNFNSGNVEVIAQTFKNALGFILNPVFPHTWMINSTKGNLWSLIILFGAGILLFCFTYFLSQKLDFSISGKKAKKSKKITFKTGRFPLIKKDLKLSFRDSQTLFLLIYPAVLPVIFFFAGNTKGSSLGVMSSLMFSAIAAFYAAYLAIMMLAEETKIWPVPKLYPIKNRTLVSNKVNIPFAIFMIEYILIVILLTVISGFSFVNIISILPMGVILYYSSLLGARLFLKNPKREVKQKNFLSGKEVFELEGATMGVAFGVFFLLNFFSTVKNRPFWIFVGREWLIYLVFIGVPILLIGLTVLGIFKELKKIKVLIENWE